MSKRDSKVKRTIYDKKEVWLLTVKETASLLALTYSGVYKGRKRNPQKWKIMDIGLFCFEHNVTQQSIKDFVEARRIK